MNCLLGLLIVPKEKLLEKIPETGFESIHEWGIDPNSIKSVGKCNYGHEHQLNLRQLVQRLRNAISHFKINPIHLEGEVHAFSFKDRNGFHAEITLAEIKSLVTKLAAHLDEQA